MGLDGIYKVQDDHLKVVPKGFDNAKMSKEEFLKVLLANIQWQDPLEAQDINEFISNSVKLREMEVLNTFESSVKEMTDSLNSYSLIFATSFIGKAVKYVGNQTYIKDGKGKIEFKLDEPASQVHLSILDSSGKLIEEKEFRELSPGVYPIEIDNSSLKDGYYTVNVTAVGPEGSEVKPTIYSFAFVSGVKRDEEGKVYAITPVKEIPIEDITAIGG